MQNSNHSAGLKQRLLKGLRLTNQPRIRAYHGHGQPQNLVIYGHVLKFGPLPRSKYRINFLRNTLALIRLFIVKPYAHAQVEIEWKGKRFGAECDEAGFFKIEWADHSGVEPGWHKTMIYGKTPGIEPVHAAVFIPYKTQLGYISDIDDTFLISHSSHMFRRLQALLTQNPRSRQPFDGSVLHYQLLSQSNTVGDNPNPFFYVSSSEWNLYDYILEFARVNGIPEGVYLLNTLKQVGELFKTGQNNHKTKFTRIVRILEQYPERIFTLLGDSSQQDAFIYQAVVEHFPGRIKAVYIRDVEEKNLPAVKEALEKISNAGVATCLFSHSSEAIEHSRSIGLINKEEADLVPPGDGILFSKNEATNA